MCHNVTSRSMLVKATGKRLIELTKYSTGLTDSPRNELNVKTNYDLICFKSCFKIPQRQNRSISASGIECGDIS